MDNENTCCIIIGASHAGVNCAFALRKEGWSGKILLIDKDPNLPYHRPPLSKAYLNQGEKLEGLLLKPRESYEKANIQLLLGKTVSQINRTDQTIALLDGSVYAYQKLVLATGARPFIPNIPGLEAGHSLYALRSKEDAMHIRGAILSSQEKRIVIIGGGYIGLEAAASLIKMGAKVTVLEREDRVLKRVTSPEMSVFFQRLHLENGVDLFTKKEVIAFEKEGTSSVAICSDGSRYTADVLIIAVGIRVNQELAASANLEVKNGIQVDPTGRTNDAHIYAIGDCTFHFNPSYSRFVRLESVQNAVDQAKVAAASICGEEVTYNAIPWFWSDQFDVKLQMVGLSTGYDQALRRDESGEGIRFSIWYFKEDALIAVDAVNNPKAYILGMKFIKSSKRVNRDNLVNPAVVLKPNTLAES